MVEDCICSVIKPHIPTFSFRIIIYFSYCSCSQCNLHDTHHNLRYVFLSYEPKLVILTLLLQVEEVKTLTHIQFTSWPDHGVPKSPSSFLEYHKMAQQMYQPEVGPTLVHCRQIRNIVYLVRLFVIIITTKY